LSDFQDELHAEGYEKVVIIGVGQSAQSNFNSNFCANSDLPLVLDQSPNLPIYNQFNGGHRDLVVMDVDGITELYRATLNSTYFPLYEDDFRDAIISNYLSSMPGDINSDEVVNILDIIQLANMILSGDYSDTLINSNSAGCDSIAYLNLTITNTTGLLDVTNTEKTLLKITDMLGQETPYRRNTPLFYIYDDGTVEKRIVIE